MIARTYNGYSLEEARQELELWKEAKRAAATGKSYQMGSRQLTRYDLSEIDKQIAFFAKAVEALASGTGGGLVRVSARMHRGTR